MHNSFILQQYICYTTLLKHVSSSMLLIIRRTNCITSGIVTLCKQPYSMRMESILYGCLQRVTIPEAVVIQLVLLMMRSVLLETC